MLKRKLPGRGDLSLVCLISCFAASLVVVPANCESHRQSRLSAGQNDKSQQSRTTQNVVAVALATRSSINAALQRIVTCGDGKLAANCSESQITNSTWSGPPINLSTHTNTNLKLAPTTTQAPSWISRTTGGIYRVLSGAFSRVDETSTPVALTTTTQPPKTRNLNAIRKTQPTSQPPIKSSSQASAHYSQRPEIIELEEPEYIDEIYESTTSTTTRRPSTTITRQKPTVASQLPTQPIPRVNTTTSIANPSTTTLAPPTTQRTNLTSDQSNVELFTLLQAAIRSFYALKDTIFLNRSTRLAPNNFFDDSSEYTLRPRRPVAGNLVLNLADEQNGEASLDNKHEFATKEDIHLLCRLLHKQLEADNITSSTDRTDESTTAATTIIATTTTRVASTEATPISSTRKPQSIDASRQRSLYVDDSDELGENHESHLLESVFGYQPVSRRTRNESLIVSGQRILLNLYNFAARSKSRKWLATSEMPPTGSDYEADSTTPATGETTTSSNDAFVPSNDWIRLVTLRKATRSSKGVLNMVYWLLEPVDSSNAIRMGRFRLLDSREASKLLDSLEHAFIQRQLDSANLSSLVLVAPYRFGQSPPLDDKGPNLPTGSENVTNTSNDVGLNAQPQTPHTPSAFRLLLDKFTQPNFADNLHFYLILFLIFLLLIILCIAIPLMKCRNSSTPAGLAPVASSGIFVSGTGNKRRRGNYGANLARSGKPATVKRHKEPSIDPAGLGEPSDRLSRLSVGAFNCATDLSSGTKAAGQSSDAIWRKLSNTTTTTTQDETRTMRDDGLVSIPIVRDGAEDHRLQVGASERHPHFEWYSFEDKLERQERRTVRNERDTQTYTINDRRQVTKSVQTSADSKDGDFATMPFEFKRSEGSKNSDTLTKSELVMLKEKLVPIGERKEVANKTSQVPDYVNQATIEQQYRSVHGPLESSVGGYIDASESSLPPSKQPDRSLNATRRRMEEGSDDDMTQSSVATGPATGGERVPRMQHLELPSKTRSKVEEIKAELGKLEQRDVATATMRRTSGEPTPPSTSTYRRYPDII